VDTLFSNEIIPNEIIPNEINKSYLPLARYLADIILIKKNIKITTQNIISWSKEIQKLIEVNKVSIKRIKIALQWYEKNIGQPYVPVIESGRSLREKFIKLEDAIERDKEPVKKEKQVPSKYWDGMEYKFDPERNGWYHRNGDKWIWG
jgi:hypothetical protein